MQNFKKIDRQKNQAFFILKFAALFLTHPVLINFSNDAMGYFCMVISIVFRLSTGQYQGKTRISRETDPQYQVSPVRSFVFLRQSSTRSVSVK